MDFEVQSQIGHFYSPLHGNISHSKNASLSLPYPLRFSSRRPTRPIIPSFAFSTLLQTSYFFPQRLLRTQQLILNSLYPHLSKPPLPKSAYRLTRRLLRIQLLRSHSLRRPNPYSPNRTHRLNRLQHLMRTRLLQLPVLCAPLSSLSQ
jgi:hypothetical protein